jgi:hypothetical protein
MTFRQACALVALCSLAAPSTAVPRIAGSRPSTLTGGESCRSNDPRKLCFAIRYVSYRDESGVAVANRKMAIEQVRKANALWAQCGIAFELENYETADPRRHGLRFGEESERETYEIRRRFARPSSLLVVVTGEWSSYAVAWTEPPGFETHGTILSSEVASDPEILAHELGHYLNLDHPVSQPREWRANLMNWRVYPDSRRLTQAQCARARKAGTTSWKSARRTSAGLFSL